MTKAHHAHSLRRRAFLLGAAAAAAIPAAASTFDAKSFDKNRTRIEMAAKPLGSDAALIALQPEIDAADQACEAVYSKRHAAEAVYFALRPSTARHDRLRAETGLDAAAEKAQDGADYVRRAIFNDKIIPIRATTLNGLIFKARYAADHFPAITTRTS